jgi:very-short-patch-repair endonuclease
VSLLGPDQAKYIDTLVRSRCDAAELMRRKFECGDARVFQGSERDIMFLSMVVDPKNARAVSGNTAEQRFNVAGSRARDRMYLVRSVKLTDLSHLDLRAGMLGHFSKPSEGSYEENKNLIELCESGFEKQVYSALVDKGYRVIPQVKAGSFRIDMVVEGERDARLAIECDGDEFHGPDRWAADMGRQRVLERAGWTFWRCFASTWSMRRDEVLEELLQRLTAMGIEPLGALEKTPSLVEQRTWIPRAQIDVNSGEQPDEAGAEIEVAIVTAQASTQDLFATEVRQPIVADAHQNSISPTVASKAIKLADGTYDVGALKQYAEAYELVVDDRRSSGGGLWVLNPDRKPLEELTPCVKVLLSVGFDWAEKKQGWYRR